MASNKYTRKNVTELYSQIWDYGRTIKASSFTLEFTTDSGEVKESDLVEIKTTRNEYNKQTKETKVLTSFVSVSKEQFAEIATNFLELA